MVILNKIIFCVLDKGLQYFSLRTIYISINKVTVSWGISRLVSFVGITYIASKQNLSIIDVTNSLLFFLLFAMYNIPNRNMIVNIVYQIIPHSPILSLKVAFVNKKRTPETQVSKVFSAAKCSASSLTIRSSISSCEELSRDGNMVDIFVYILVDTFSAFLALGL